MVRAMTYPPTAADLEEKVVNYLKDCKRKSYRQMKKDGDLEEYIQIQVDSTIRAAQNLMKCGANESEAWNRAIRSVILESESD